MESQFSDEKAMKLMEELLQEDERNLTAARMHELEKLKAEEETMKER